MSIASVRLAALILLAGCDHVLGLSTVSTHDDGAPADAWAPPALVQQNAQANQGSAQLSVKLPVLPAAQHVVVAIGGSTSGLLPLPTGGGVANWQPAGASCYSTNLQLWFGVTDGTNATVTITSTNAGGSDIARLEVTEWKGLATVNPVDTEANNGTMTGSGTIDLAVVTTSPSDLLVFAATGFSAFDSPDASWSPLSPASECNVSQDAWYKVAAGAGSQTAQTMYVGGYDGVLTAFRAAQ